ncbi:MAG: glycine oxidase ThiO [Pirellulaceae bacterium]
MHDVLIIGGGVIGLSLAWDLAQHGRSVRVIDRGQPGREASWAGAGILPPANLLRPALHPYDHLCGLSSRLHDEWAPRLQSLTGIDTGYRRCGGIYLARTAGEAAALAAWAAEQQSLGIAVERLERADLTRIEPGLRLSVEKSPVFRGPCFLLPDEAQLRNPRHVRALVAAGEKLGVTIAPNVTAIDATIEAGQIAAITTDAGPLRARQVCFTAGAWTGQLLVRLGIAAGILPIRGQMVMFRCARKAIAHILNEGSRYIVPRDDGRVLAGATEEEVGFDKRTTEQAITELTAWARLLVPALAAAPVEQSWAGLRPGSFDGFPYLGPLPGLANAFVAAGHFRSGIYLSPATAVVMSQLMRGEPPEVDLAPFRVGR